MRLDSTVVDRLRRELTPRAYLRVTPLKYAASPLGMGFGETRFASPSRSFTVLYIGRTLTTAVAETLVRDRVVGRSRRWLAQDELEAWGVTEVTAATPLSLLDLTGSGLVQLGAPTSAVRGKAQGPGRRFSETLHAEAPSLDGILYPSRLTNETSIAVYERVVGKLRASPVQPLIDQPLLIPALTALIFRFSRNETSERPGHESSARNLSICRGFDLQPAHLAALQPPLTCILQYCSMRLMSTPDTETPDPSILRAERHLRLLEELSEIGMDLARALRDKTLAEAEAPEEPPTDAPAANTPTAKPADPAAAFARLSRAIRLTLALERRADDALRALRAGVAAERETRRAETLRRAEADAQARREAHVEKVRRLVLDVADREVEEPEDHMDLEAALDERLEEDEAYADLETLPLYETVKRLCADLELRPDWRRWTGEDWGPREPFFRPKSARPWLPSRRPTDYQEEPAPAVPAAARAPLE